MFINKYKKMIFLVLAIVMTSSCTQIGNVPETPKQRLQDYISRSFSINRVGDKKDLEAYLSGEAKRRLAAWSDEQFRKAFIDNKRQFVKFRIRENKEITQGEVKITYELSYIDLSKKSYAKVTNKKMATLIQEDSHWYIQEVKNLKELIEYKNEMTLP